MARRVAGRPARRRAGRALGGAWTATTDDGALALGGSDARWRLLAVSGGRPVSLFGLFDGAALTPLAAGDGERTVAL